MTFTTLALIGLGVAAGGAAYAATRKNGQSEASSQVGQPGGGRRNPGKDAEFTGDTAMTRDAYAKKKADEEAAAATPPDTAKLASANMASAYAAGERQRKRAASGSSLLSAPPASSGGGGSYAPKTLLGS